MPITRPRLRADQVRVGDRLLDAPLDPARPGPALPLVVSASVTGAGVRLMLDGWDHIPVLPPDAKVVVERVTG